jgi:acyl-coenzyme A thioesterase PaaI-like protein
MENLLSVFAISRPRYDGGVMSAEQVLNHAVADHRGKIEMPAYAVMVESVTSGGFWYSLDAPVGSVQSWLSLTAAAPARIGQRLFATSRLIQRDDAYGALTVQILDDDRDVVCAGVGRCVQVSRGSDALAAIRHAPPPPPDQPIAGPPQPRPAPSPIDPELDGKQILTGISDGRIAAGALVDLLSATVTLADDRVRLIVAPQPWMANPLGAMQGGVVAAILGQACSLAGQTHTAPGQQYALVDLTAHFWRSPPVVAGAITVTTGLHKLGRRIGTVSALMVAADDVPLARAVADVQYA